MRQLPALTAVAVAVGACVAGDGGGGTGAAVAVRDSAGIRIVEHSAPTAPERWSLAVAPVLQVSQELPAEELALDPVAVFEGPEGTVGVGDGNQVGWHALLLYDSAGSFRARVGGGGRGPGEFGGQLWWADRYRADSLVAWDRRGPTGPSIKVFGPDGGYSRDVAIPQPERPRPDGTLAFSAGVHGWFSDGAFLTSSAGSVTPPAQPGPMRFQHLLLSVDPAGQAWDTIGEFGLMEAYWTGTDQVGYRFGSPGIVRAFGDQVLLANGPDYQYTILDRAGAPTLIVRRLVEAREVTSEDIARMMDTFMALVSERPGVSEEDLIRIRDVLESTPTAPTKPAYSNALVDDALRVWVERFRWPDPWSVPLDPEASEWDVFSPGGDWLATVAVPARVLLLSVSGNRAYGVRVDALDVKHVEVYEIVPSDSLGP